MVHLDSSTTSGMPLPGFKALCFTQNEPGDDADLRDALLKLARCIEFVFQRDRGENGNVHWQGFLRFNVKLWCYLQRGSRLRR